ncbi:anhydro-N-acetylmuramic acid kinase [Porticoccus litoralis]|uniref:Anhydro-N-acetylmuramic acid kinase n=1 Tax=Porticoccus litoralis TaxID=434086 RepID=A0AAW8B4W7_9GAMM|nr:anhydro-N-acetylmuramic acid kinase [Porticoccus litoralis]MDP1520609.1 anhydro-N-acetylmuramic acid kinase [Porticoccus litoralis]
MPDAELYIGLMSGTSADSIDAALVDFSHGRCQLLGTHSSDISDLKSEIHALAQPGDNEIQRLGQLDRELGVRFAETVNQLLRQQQLTNTAIHAIGSHGQTIRHRPPSSEEGHAFSLQIGDPNTIAGHTGITTVADFRRRDIALGGHGAPLVPAFHQAIFHQPGARRAIINIGGIANITLLEKSDETPMQGYDTGPGNGLMDAWTLTHLQQPYDAEGNWSRRGKTLPALLEQLLSTPYLALPPPKSTGRELFNLDWLNGQLGTLNQPFEPADVQATLLDFTAQTIASAIKRHSEEPLDVFLCGGGAHNRALVEKLSALLDPIQVATTDSIGVPVDWVEAIAFAWLAQQTLEGKPGNAPAVTGARTAAILGAIYPG